MQYAKSDIGLAVVVSPDDAFKYASFYKEVLEGEEGKIKEREYDLSDLVCPLPRMRATEIIDNLRQGELARIILGDADSLINVAKELKARVSSRTLRRKRKTASF